MSSSVNDNRWWSLHTHSKFSVNDALPSPERCVERAVELGYPALGLTDHGVVSGNIALYKACRKAGIEPFPGVELYVVNDAEYAGRKDNMHLTVAAYNTQGYRNLVKIATTTAMKFWYKPRIDLADFAEMHEAGALEGLVVATGCHFGVLPQTLIRRGPDAAAAVLKALDSWFPLVYVELQNHGIGEEHHDETELTDDEVTEGLWQVATSVGVPVIVTRDSHYINPDERHYHDALKRLVSWGEDPDDATFPGDGYFMTTAQGLRGFFEPHMLQAGLASLDQLADLGSVRLPELENFTLKVPNVPFEDPQAELERLVLERFHASPFASHLPAATQMDTELEVIKNGGMASYLLFVNMVCEFMRENRIGYHARGSAAGSFVNYLLKITQVDPLRYKLRFDRFLSRNRMKPPDVDLDIEHRRRHEVQAFVDKRWEMRYAGTLMKYSLEEDETSEEGSKGSLRVKFYSTVRKRGFAPPLWKNVPQRDRDELKALADMKLISGYGSHPGGLIVAPTEADIDQIPLAKVAGHLVTAYDKKDMELLGYTKLDLLGSRTRTAIETTTKLLDVDFETIPEDDRETFTMINKGRVSGVFQLDGRAMRDGLQRLGPRNIAGIIAAQALFRPATMHSNATNDYLSRRRGKPLPSRHEDIARATKDTYGVLLYQEQVMDVLEALGMDQAELEKMLDAVKASNEYSAGAALAIEQAMPRIKELAGDREWSSDDLRWLIESLGAYADYSFNKAHAAAYGIIAYRMAYLKCHHPLQYWCGLLDAYSDAPKQKGRPHPTVTYTQSAQFDNVPVLSPHVNRSQPSYSIDGRGIRRGLTSIPGVGIVTAKELVANAPYDSLSDLGQRVLPARVHGAKYLVLGVDPETAGGAIAALYEARALRGLT